MKGKIAMHVYLSTACIHGLHEKCNKVCKYGEPPEWCVCGCHGNHGSAAIAGTTSPALLVKSYWLVPPSPADAGASAVSLDRQNQIDGSDLWAVRRRGYVLNREGDFEYEPIPSGRDEEFLARCRFESIEEAVEMWTRRGGS